MVLLVMEDFMGKCLEAPILSEILASVKISTKIFKILLL